MNNDYFQKVLLKFSENPVDFWTVDDAMKGISIMGGTGSGKTSASGKTLAKKFLKEGWGGLVLCAKTDEADLWSSYCKETGRENDLIIFGKGAIHQNEEIVFNPMDYEMKRPGEGAGETQNITNIFMNIYRMGNRIASEGDVREERYWDTALKRCLNRTIELLKLAREDLSYRNMVKVISSAQYVRDDLVDDILNNIKEGKSIGKIEAADNFCQRCLALARLNVDEDTASNETINSLNLVNSYFIVAFPSMGDKTRSVVTESFMGLAEPFMSGMLYRHFSGATNIFPEWTYEKNKVIVLDFSIKEFLDAGIIAQCVFKLLFQQAIERRDVTKYPTPVFLWVDEAHYFINPYDQIFLTTARSSRTATVYLSQNISNYLAVIGSGSDAKARVDSLMGNLSTKIFHANSDAETNEYASKLIGNAPAFLNNKGNSQSFLNLNFQHSNGVAEQYLPQIQPREFTTLRMGGQNNNYEVEAIVFITGKLWSTETNFSKLLFKQNIKLSKTD